VSHGRSLVEVQAQRRDAEGETRKARLWRGVLGLWDRLTGQRPKTLTRNEQGAQRTLQRGRQERDQLKAQQLAQRRTLHTKIKAAREQHQSADLEIRAEFSRSAVLHTAADSRLTARFNAKRRMPRHRASIPGKPKGLDYHMSSGLRMEAHGGQFKNREAPSRSSAAG